MTTSSSNNWVRNLIEGLSNFLYSSDILFRFNTKRSSLHMITSMTSMYGQLEHSYDFYSRELYHNMLLVLQVIRLGI
mgnify:CR=1 FL=1